MHPLDGPRLKIRRTEIQIKALGDLQTAMWKNSDYSAVKEKVNPKTGRYIYTVRASGDPPDPEWGVYIGEIAHNLRSALDGLVYQLAILNGAPADTRDTQFPVFLYRYTRVVKGRQINGFEGGTKGKGIGRGRGMIQRLCPKHQTLIKRLQPYQRSRGGHNNSLHLLSEINNADKHRLIQVVIAKRAGGPAIGIWGDAPDDFPFVFVNKKVIVLKNGTKLGEAAPGVLVSPTLIPVVAFWEGCSAVKGLGVTFTLGRIAEHVSEIVDSFAPEFD